MATTHDSMSDKGVTPPREEPTDEEQLRHDRYLMLGFVVALLVGVALLLWLAGTTDVSSEFKPDVMPGY